VAVHLELSEFFERFNFLIRTCVYIDVISNSRLHSTSEDISWTVSVLLCSWTCGGSFCVITVSTDQLHTVQFVQYLYSKFAVLLCSWTCSGSFCVITVSTVQLETTVCTLFVCLFHLLNWLTEYYDIWRHTFAGHQSTKGFSSLPLMTTTWQTREFMNQ